MAPLKLPAAGAGGRGVEWSLEVAFQIVVRPERGTVQAMAIAGSPLIHQDHVVLVAINRADHIGRHFGSRLAWPPHQVEDGPLVRMWAARGNEHDLQGQ